jgi:hypothetical protein
MCKNCVHHACTIELRDHRCQSPHICFSQPLLVPKCIYIQPENFLLLLCVLIKNNVQQSWERWSYWSYWWSIYLRTVCLINSIPSIPIVEKFHPTVKFHPIISFNSAAMICAHVNPTNLMGSSLLFIQFVIDDGGYVCFWSFILPTSNWIQIFSRSSQNAIPHNKGCLCHTVALPFYIKKYVS